MTTGTLKIHSENILPIIKKWLYSDKDIFLRELVSNACDALNKVAILRAQGELPAAPEPDLQIHITVDKAKKTIEIRDSGIGMSAEEVEKYIAQIAFSGAEEFIEKYRSQTEKDPIIGHFGLGFYSAYMVAERVDIDTLSHAPKAASVFWSSDGASGYTMDAGKRQSRGTTITLHVDKESAEYLEEAKIRELLERFCKFLPFPIMLNDKPLGNKAPLWLKSASECTDKEYLDFHRALFPQDPDPVFWIHLNVDYPFHLQGILYFPKVHRRFDAESSTIQLYCNRVFVADHCKEILPDYLTLLRGCIDSPDIPLNVSRSTLQVDKNVRQLAAHIAKKVSDRLTSLYKSDKTAFLATWTDIEPIIKLGALQDDKFYERIQDILLWKNSKSEWTTAAEHLARNPGGKVLYTPQNSATSVSQALQAKGVEFLYTNAGIDTSVIHHLERKLSCKFQRLDSALEETLLDATREKTLLDAEGKSESAHIAALIGKAIDNKDVEVEAKSLAVDSLTGLVLLDEEERRFRDYMAIAQGKTHTLTRKKKFVVNTNNKLVQAALRLSVKQPELANDLARHLFDLNLLTQKELEPEQTQEVHARHLQLLEKMAALL